MFNRSVKKIVATVVVALVLFFGATVSVIYFSSYADMKRQSEERLNRYADMYELDFDDDDDTNNRFLPVPENNLKEPPFDAPREYELSTFYSVAFSESGEILAVDNGKPEIVSVAELTERATAILHGGKNSGADGSLSFLVVKKQDYTLVAFIDDSMMKGNMNVLLKYILIVGGAGIVLFFGLSVVIAKRIVRPLKKNDEKQKQFVSDAGHELKTPVSVINANAELLSREIGENRWLENIKYENEKMSALIKDLLDLSRAENAKVVFGKLDFSRLVIGETLPFESVAFDKGLNVIQDVDEGIGIYGNATQLKQLVSILLDNAIRHGEGGEIRISLKRNKKNTVLSVENSGEEIPEKQEDKIFERFYRGDQSRTDDGNHYGLGLAIAKAVSEAHNGKIGVKCKDKKVKFFVVFQG